MDKLLKYLLLGILLYKCDKAAKQRERELNRKLAYRELLALRAKTVFNILKSVIYFFILCFIIFLMARISIQ